MTGIVEWSSEGRRKDSATGMAGWGTAVASKRDHDSGDCPSTEGFCLLSAFLVPTPLPAVFHGMLMRFLIFR